MYHTCLILIYCWLPNIFSYEPNTHPRQPCPPPSPQPSPFFRGHLFMTIICISVFLYILIIYSLLFMIINIIRFYMHGVPLVFCVDITSAVSWCCTYVYVNCVLLCVFTGNCGKVTYYISGSIAYTFLKFLYLDCHSGTYITTYFQYYYRSLDIRYAS